MSRISRAIVVVLAVVTLVGVGPALSAAAHTALVESDPRDGATIEVAPSEVTLTFNEAISDLSPPQARLTGPGTAEPRLGAAQVDDAVLVIPVTEVIRDAGEYSLDWRVVSEDGHAVSGTIHFTFAPPVAATPIRAASPDSLPTPEGVNTAAPGGTKSENSNPVLRTLTFVVPVTVIALFLVVLFLVLRRRRG